MAGWMLAVARLAAGALLVFPAWTTAQLIDLHTWVDDCDKTCLPEATEQAGLGLEMLWRDGARATAVPSAQASRWLSAASGGRYHKCNSTSSCTFDVQVQTRGGQCEATLPYCGLCVINGVAKTLTWNLSSVDGKDYRFGSRKLPNMGVVIPRSLTRVPGQIQWREHFHSPTRVSNTQFTWETGDDRTWLRPLSLVAHGHDLIVSEFREGNPVGMACKVVDPPIVNVAN